MLWCHGAYCICQITNVSIDEPIEFEGEHFDEGFRADLIVKVSPVHKKQLLTYLRLADLKLGYLLNFGDALMKDGIRRIINGKLEA